MIPIDWVLVRNATRSRATEFEFAVAELRRQLPSQARWLYGDEEVQRHIDGDVDPSSLVLMLEHPWLTLEGRCLERLGAAMQQGYEVVEACDSRNPFPMRAGGYATQRGMERFVDEHPFHVEECAVAHESGAALVRLTTMATLLSLPNQAAKTGRVCGAFAHDVSSYFGSDRSEVLGLIPPTAHRFLDIGGGEGNFLKLVKATRTAETHLVELDPDIASVAVKNHCADHVWNGDFLAYQSSLRFDCVSFLDMLEHVPNPESYLCHARTLLADEGVVLASIPNVGHWSVVADLIEGRWDYVPAGVHCVTHLRFFTEKTIKDLFDRAGYEIESLDRVLVPCPMTWLEQWQRTDGLRADRASLDTYAYLVVGRSKAEG